MLFTVVLVCCVAAAAAAPSDIIVDYDLEHHDHVQRGEPGAAVTGSYSFLSADGVEHEVTYIADDKGFRVTGDTVLGAPQPATTPRPAQTQAPVTEAPAAGEVAHVLTVKTVHAVPVQLVHLAYVLPQTYSSVPFYSGQFQCFYGAAELNRSGEQEVVGFDGARYILKKVE